MCDNEGEEKEDEEGDDETLEEWVLSVRETEIQAASLPWLMRVMDLVRAFSTSTDPKSRVSWGCICKAAAVGGAGAVFPTTVADEEEEEG